MISQSTPASSVRTRTRPLKALVLSGGGAKGAYEAGLVAGLAAHGESFDIACGTSIGAINAAFVAQNDIDGLTRLWSTISRSNIVRPVPAVEHLQRLFREIVGIVGGSPLGKVADAVHAVGDLHALSPLDRLAKLVGALDETAAQRILNGSLDLNRVERILVTSATNLSRQTADTFYIFPHTSDAYIAAEANFTAQEPDAIPFLAATYAETIRASGAIPAAFAPVPLAFPASAQPSAYVDGGVTNNTPIGQAIDAGADDITIVYVDPPPAAGAVATRNPTANLVEILLGCFSIMQQRILDLDYAAALRVNAAVAAGHGRPDKRCVRIRAFHPDPPLRVGIIGFDDQSAIDDAFAQGQHAAQSASSVAYAV